MHPDRPGAWLTAECISVRTSAPAVSGGLGHFHPRSTNARDFGALILTRSLWLREPLQTLSMLPPYSAFLWLAQRLTRQIRSPASSETTIDPSGSSSTSTGRPTPLRKLCPLPERLLPRRSRTTWYPTGVLRFQLPCSAISASPCNSGNMAP